MAFSTAFGIAFVFAFAGSFDPAGSFAMAGSFSFASSFAFAGSFGFVGSFGLTGSFAFFGGGPLTIGTARLRLQNSLHRIAKKVTSRHCDSIPRRHGLIFGEPDIATLGTCRTFRNYKITSRSDVAKGVQEGPWRAVGRRHPNPYL